MVQRWIDLLPRTLATIGDSILEKTGWHVTIMAGGPCPDNDGMIMTYLLATLSFAPKLLKLTQEPIDHTQGRRKMEKNLTSSLV
jgi:hypothetical protein